MLIICKLAKNIGAQAKTLAHDIDNKYRAIGKQSGDPLVLLRNGENEMSAANDSPAKYGQNTQVSALDK